MMGIGDLINFSTMDSDDRMTILAIAAAVMLFSLIIVLCKICPGCPMRSSYPIRPKYPFDSHYDDLGRYR